MYVFSIYDQLISINYTMFQLDALVIIRVDIMIVPMQCTEQT